MHVHERYSHMYTHITHTTHAHVHAHIHTQDTQDMHTYIHTNTHNTHTNTHNTHTQIHIPGVICDKYDFVLYSVNQNTLLNCNVM